MTGEGGTGRPRRPPPRRPTKASLEAAAQAYLARYAASAEALRRVLARKAERAARARDDVDPDACAAWIDDIVDRYRRSGLLDDAAYAAMKARAIGRRGGSARRIRETLAQKGVDAEHVEAALAARAEEAGGDPELAAARALARRRRLGPWRPAAARAEHRQRDLASLARAGFPFDVAKAVVDGEAEEG
jgi:regulatory protein